MLKKYMVDGILDTLTEEIKRDWPETLEEWDRSCDAGGIRHDFAEGTAPEPISAILFALAVDIPSILPAAFYQLCITPCGNEWEEQPRYKRCPSARWRLLDAEFLLRFLKAKEALHDMFRSSVHKYRVYLTQGVFVDDSCIIRAEMHADDPEYKLCADIMKEMDQYAQEVLASLTEPVGSPDCLNILQALPGANGLCQPCRVQAWAAIDEEREHLWSSLARHFQ